MTLQQYLADLKGKQVTVIGIGVSNRPLLRLLAQAGAVVTARDKKTEEQLGDIVPQLKEWGYNRLEIRTDRGRFGIGVGLDRYLSVDLVEDGQVVSGYEPNRDNSILEDTSILLELLQASGEDGVRAKMDVLREQGLLTPRKNQKRK